MSLRNKTEHEATTSSSPIQTEAQDRGKPVVFRRCEPGTQPDYLYPPYRSTRLRAPSQPLILMPQTLSETTGPVFGHADIGPNDHDLTAQHAGEPLGERIIVRGRVMDGDGHPISNSLIEVWQANSAGRYAHVRDCHPAPLDPNFTGTGRTLT